MSPPEPVGAWLLPGGRGAREWQSRTSVQPCGLWGCQREAGMMRVGGRARPSNCVCVGQCRASVGVAARGSGGAGVDAM